MGGRNKSGHDAEDCALDKRTAWENDTTFVDEMLHAGGQAELFAVTAAVG